MVQILSIDGAVRRGHESIADSKSCKIDLDFSCRVLGIDLLGNGGNKLAGVRLSEGVEGKALVLWEEFVELDQTFVKFTAYVILLGTNSN